MSIASDAPLAALVSWTEQHPAYVYRVAATEWSGSAAHTTVMEVRYDGRLPTETVQILSGTGRGSTIVWRGGDRAVVRPAGPLHVVPLAMSVRDPRLLSPRRNDVRAAIFSRVTDCLTAHAAALHVDHSSERVRFTIDDPAGIRCGDENGEAGVTRDRVTVSAHDDAPLMRERYAGEMLVERWQVQDLHLLP